MNNPTDVSQVSATCASRSGDEAASRADQLIRRATTGTVLFLAGVAGVVSYGHMHLLAVRYGEEPWTAALLPLSVDGMIVAASLTLLWDSRRGRSGGILPWALLIVASGASLAANVAVAHPMVISRVIAAWPSFALIGAYEMLMRQIRQSIAVKVAVHDDGAGTAADVARHLEAVAVPVATAERQTAVVPGGSGWNSARHRQREAWQWAVSHRLSAGSLATGETIAEAFDRSPRWGRLVKNAGLNGKYDSAVQSAA
jgi:hypothetical protein